VATAHCITRMTDAAPAQGTYAGKRVCQVIKLRKEHEEEYKRIHASVWPGVLAALRRAHIVDYSIFLLPTSSLPTSPAEEDQIAGLLIATFKYVGADWDADMAAVGEDEETRSWWAVTDGMQASLVSGATGSKEGEWWLGCEEVFRFEG